MSRNKQNLVRHLIVVVLIKLVILMALWYAFFRDAHVDVDTERAAENITGTVSTQGVSK